MPSIIALSVAIAIWSLSPLLVTRFSGLASPYHSAAFAIWLATLAALIFSLFNVAILKNIFQFLSAWRTNQKDIFRLVLLACFAFVLYPLCYFFGLQKGNPIAANLINYTWPIIGIIIELKLSKKTVTMEALMGATLGFCGAGVVLHTALSPASFAQSISLWSTSNIQELLPYIIAAAGAFFYAAYSGAASVNKPPNLVDTKAQFVLMLLIASLAQLFIFVALYLFGFRASVSLGGDRSLAFVVYAVGLAVAHFSWLYAVQNMSGERPFIAVYLTPVGSTLLLAMVSSTPPSSVVPGLLFILVGIYLSQHSERPVKPLLATVLFAFISWAITKIAVEVPQTLDINRATLEVNLIQLLLALFAILSGFTLANSIQRNSRQKLEFIEYVNCIRRIERHGAQCIEIMESADGCLRAAVDENFSSGHHYGLATLSEIAKLEANIGNIQNKLDSEIIMSACSELRVRRGTLEYLRVFGVSTYEWFILVLLAAVMVALSFSIQAGGIVFLMMRTAIVGALALVLFAIRDFNNGQPNKLRDFIIQSQLVGDAKAQSKAPYVSLYALLVSDDGNRDLAIMRVRSLDNNGNPCTPLAGEKRLSDPPMRMMWLIIAASIMVMYMILT